MQQTEISQSWELYEHTRTLKDNFDMQLNTPKFHMRKDGREKTLVRQLKEWLDSDNLTVTNAGWDTEQQKLIHCPWEQKIGAVSWKTVDSLLQG